MISKGLMQEVSSALVEVKELNACLLVSSSFLLSSFILYYKQRDRSSFNVISFIHNNSLVNVCSYALYQPLW